MIECPTGLDTVEGRGTATHTCGPRCLMIQNFAVTPCHRAEIATKPKRQKKKRSIMSECVFLGVRRGRQDDSVERTHTGRRQAKRAHADAVDGLCPCACGV